MKNCIVPVMLSTVLLSSCSNTKNVSTSHAVIITEAYHSVVTKNDLGLRGDKFSLSIVGDKTLQLDSLIYNNEIQPLKLTEKRTDTLSVEAYFYKKDTPALMEQNDLSSHLNKVCELIYSSNGSKQRMLISSFKPYLK